MYAKKSLGQHFLKSERALDTIVDSADPTKDDVVLEIGPGQGALTDKLLESAGKLVAVEKDDHLYEQLKVKYISQIKAGALDLVHGDIVDFDPDTLRTYTGLTYKLVANIPYNITGLILRKFLSASYQPQVMVVLVQKEVAERIIARGEKESILSISVKAYGTPRLVERVLAGSFAPPPKVDSAILAISAISKDFFTHEGKTFSENGFFKLLHAGFASKRKKLSSNLSVICPKQEVLAAFTRLSLDQNARAEDIRIDTWQKLAASLAL